MKIRFIGDVHGKMEQYKFIAEQVERSVQVGDFGAGFVELPILTSGHRFIRGNHDSPEACKKHPRWIPDGTIEGDILYIGGAWSIDQEWRTPGVSWWPDEQLSIMELYDCLSTAIAHYPKVLVTHDCPHSVAPILFGGNGDENVSYKTIHPSRTSQALDSILDYVKPDVWIFGHWHNNVDKMIGRTRFICLGELSYMDLEV